MSPWEFSFATPAVDGVYYKAGSFGQGWLGLKGERGKEEEENWDPIPILLGI